MDILGPIVLWVSSYLFGSIPIGLFVARLVKGVDIRTIGSGNIGATNVSRAVGPGPAIVVLLLDMLKGVVPVGIARLVGFTEATQVLAALCAIVGHDFSLYLKFRGGKGVSTTFGASAVLMPWLVPVMVILAIVILWLTRTASKMSLAASVGAGLVVISYWLAGRLTTPYLCYALVAPGLIIWCHRENIGRILAGTEPRLGETRGRAPKTRPAAHRG